MKSSDPNKPVFLDVKVTPNASQNKIEGWEEGRLKVRIRGVPEKGRVNANLIAFIADQLDLAKSNIEMISGETSRLKRLKIVGCCSLDEIKSRLMQ